jgi:hypothetical protein
MGHSEYVVKVSDHPTDPYTALVARLVRKDRFQNVENVVAHDESASDL